MTQIAQEYHISRTFLYQLSWSATHHLEDLFRDPQHLVEPPDLLLEPWILLLRLEGKCSIPSISSIFKYFDYQPGSVGYLSEFLRDYGRCLPSTLSMAEKKVVFYLSDEIFAIRAPILVTLDAQSTVCFRWACVTCEFFQSTVFNSPFAQPQQLTRLDPRSQSSCDRAHQQSS